MKKRTAGFLTAAAIFMAALCFLPAACGKQEIEVPEVRVLPAAGRLQEMTEKVEEEIAAAEPEPVRGIYVTGPMAGHANMEELIRLVWDSELNAMVIDIKNDEGMGPVKPTGDCQFLPVSAGQFHAAEFHAKLCIQRFLRKAAAWKRKVKIGQKFQHFPPVLMFPAFLKGNVFSNGKLISAEILENSGGAGIQILFWNGAYIGAIIQNLSLIRKIETEKQFGKGGLSRSVLSHDCYSFSRFDMEADAVQNSPVFRIGKGSMFHPDSLRERDSLFAAASCRIM